MNSDRAVIASKWRWMRRRGSVLPVLAVALLAAAEALGGAGGESMDFAGFVEAVRASDDARAMSIGASVLAALQQRYANDAGFKALESRLNAAEFLARQMQQQLARAADAHLSALAGQAGGAPNSSVAPESLAVAPARRFHETSIKVFSNPVHIPGLSDQERTFLTRYYDLRLKLLTAAVARAGQALAIAEPGFKNTHDYALVLPLLHASGSQPLNLDVLPSWMKGAEQLDVLSDSCLFHFELPFQAMIVARKAAEMRAAEFAEVDFYRAAARRCSSAQARVAVDCLRKAMEHVSEDQADTAVALRFDIVQTWLECANYALAAGEARDIFDAYPDHASAGRAIWLYYYALSRNNNTDEILADIDKALADDRCALYEPKLMYVKWWALRRQRQQGARVAALEYDLLKRHGDDPMIAPILLSRATDLLAGQDYNGAYEILQQLVQKFPSTQAAVQAQRMLDKLKTIMDSK